MRSLYRTTASYLPVRTCHPTSLAPLRAVAVSSSSSISLVNSINRNNGIMSAELLHSNAINAAALSGDRTHAKLTSHIPREKGTFPATITSVTNLSPTVKQVILTIEKEQMERAKFFPGQWVDFYAPNISTLGGFSICSTPSTLENKLQLELAIKKSPAVVTAWIHEQAKAQVGVKLEIGGTFVYDPNGIQQRNPALFLVGGVGITPIVSMVRQRMETQLEQQMLLEHGDASAFIKRLAELPSTTVIYTAKSEDELVYRSDLESLRHRPNFQLYLSKTSGSEGKHADAWKEDELNVGRVPIDLLQKTLEAQKDTLHVYLCGPPSLVDELLPIIEKYIAKERIHYEKWW